jgi:hypothetical protein
LNKTYEQLAGKSTGVVKKRLERSIKSRENDAKVVVVQQHKFVPKGLPVFQWDTKVSDKSARIFENPDECCKAFEKIIFTNGMDINNEWQRLITPCLWSEDLNNFRDRQFKKNENCSWEEFKKALVAEFGKNAQQLADEANEKIMGIKMKSYETLEEFIERFNKYRNRSEFKDDLKFTTVAFRRGLFTDLKNMVEKQINTKQADVVAQRAQGKEVEPFVVTMEYLLSVSRSTYKDEGLGEKLKNFQESKRQRELAQPAPRSNYYRNSYKDNNRSNDYQKSNNSNRNGYSNGENYTHSKRKNQSSSKDDSFKKRKSNNTYTSRRDYITAHPNGKIHHGRYSDDGSHSKNTNERTLQTMHKTISNQKKG